MGATTRPWVMMDAEPVDGPKLAMEGFAAIMKRGGIECGLFAATLEDLDELWEQVAEPGMEPLDRDRVSHVVIFKATDVAHRHVPASEVN